MFRRRATSIEETPLALSASVNLGVVTLSAAKSVSVGRLISAATYNRHLHKIIKTYGEIDGIRVDFAHGRELLNWEIGMFYSHSSAQDTLSLVARHVLQARLSLCNPEEDAESAYRSSEELDTPSYPSNPMAFFTQECAALQLRYRNKLKRPFVRKAVVPFNTVRESVFSRLALERTMPSLFYPVEQRQEVRPRRGKKQGPSYAVDEKSYRVQVLEVPMVPGDREAANGGVVDIEMTVCDFAVNYDGPSDDGDRIVHGIVSNFKEELRKCASGEAEVPDNYYSIVESRTGDCVFGNDPESDAMIRAFLRTKTLFQCDSSKLLEDTEVIDALERARDEWELRKMTRRKADGLSPADDVGVYKLIAERLRLNCEDDALWCGDMPRRDELDIFASMQTLRRTTSSIERIWVGSLFEEEDKKTIGWIKRRKEVTIVETFTEYFVAMPAERRVSVWTKRSYYNSLKPPWKSHVRSQMTLPALSAICLLSTCVYPAKDPAGDAALDRDLFEDNVRNAGRGIGYALSRLVEEHKEAQLRQMGTWSRNGLKLSSFVSLAWDMFSWLDTTSKAWLVRETLTLLNDSGVNVVVSGVEGTFATMMFDTEDGENDDESWSSSHFLPAVVVDCGMPAGGVRVFKSSHKAGRFILTRDKGKNWRYRLLESQGNRSFIRGKKRHAAELPPNSVEQCSVVSGADVLY